MSSGGYFSSSVKLFEYFGIWRITSSKYRRLNFLSGFYCFFMMSAFLFPFGILVSASTLKNIGNPSEKVSLYTSAALGGALLFLFGQVVAIHVNEHEIRECTKLIEKIGKYLIYRKAAKHTIDKQARIFKFMMGLALAACSLYLLLPLIRKKFIELENPSERFLPLDIWFPGDIYQTHFYEIAYIYETAALLICTMLTVAADTIFIGSMMMTASFIKTLRLTLGERNRTDHHILIKKNDPLRNFVLELSELVHLVSEAKQAFLLFGLGKFIFAIVGLSSQIYLFRIAIRLDTAVTLLYILFELLFFCYFGEEIILEVINSAYSFYRFLESC